MAFLCETPAEKGSCPGQDYKMEKADGKKKKITIFLHYLRHLLLCFKGLELV